MFSAEIGNFVQDVLQPIIYIQCDTRHKML